VKAAEAAALVADAEAAGVVVAPSTTPGRASSATGGRCSRYSAPGGGATGAGDGLLAWCPLIGARPCARRAARKWWPPMTPPTPGHRHHGNRTAHHGRGRAARGRSRQPHGWGSYLHLGGSRRRPRGRCPLRCHPGTGHLDRCPPEGGVAPRPLGPPRALGPVAGHLFGFPRPSGCAASAGPPPPHRSRPCVSPAPRAAPRRKRDRRTSPPAPKAAGSPRCCRPLGRYALSVGSPVPARSGRGSGCLGSGASASDSWSDG
jgi:hypothetical protein